MGLGDDLKVMWLKSSHLKCLTLSKLSYTCPVAWKADLKQGLERAK